jgi:hypothetical protein
MQFAPAHVGPERGVLLSRSITMSYELITNCDLTGSGCVAPELFARWDKRPGLLMSRHGSRYWVNLEGLLARQMRWNTRVHKSSAYAGKHRSLQVNSVSPRLTDRLQAHRRPTPGFLERPHRSPRRQQADVILRQHRPGATWPRAGMCRETGSTCRTAVVGQPSSPAHGTGMTAARGLRPAHHGGLGSRDLQQALTTGLIQDNHVPGWLWRWERVLTFGLAVDRIRSGLVDERNPPRP